MADSTEAATTTAISAPFAGRTAWIRNLEAPVRDFLRTETGGAAGLVSATVASSRAYRGQAADQHRHGRQHNQRHAHAAASTTPGTRHAALIGRTDRHR